MLRHRTREGAAVFLVAIVCTIVFTWPMAARFGSAGRVDSGDGRFSIWNVAWVAHALTTDPLQLYDANIFYPNPNTLAYSEANLFAGALAAPVWLLSANPHAASNWTILCSFVFSFVLTYALVRRLTGSVIGAFVAAMAFAFCPYVFAHTPHVQLLQTFGLPLGLLALHAFVEQPRVSTAVRLGLALALAGLACGYYGIFAGLMAALGVVWFGAADGRLREGRYWLLATGAACVSVLVVAPFFVPYLDVRAAGFERSLEEARLFSVRWRSYFASAQLFDRWMLALIGQWREVLFPGFLSILLSAMTVWIVFVSKASPVRAANRRTVGFYLVLTALAVWTSLGPDAGLYAVLHETVPVFEMIRAPARFGVLVTLALAVLAGIGAASLVATAHPARRRLLVAALVVVSIGGSIVGYLPLVDAPPVDPVYARLAGLPRGPVVELPYFSERHERHRHTEYMLMSTYHWQPLVNGYSDHTPADAFEAAPRLATFPSHEAWVVIAERRTRYLVIHWHIYGDLGRPVRARVEGDPRLHLLVETPRMSLYQVVRLNP